MVVVGMIGGTTIPTMMAQFVGSNFFSLTTTSFAEGD